MADLQYFMVDPKTTNLIGPFVAHDNGSGTYTLGETGPGAAHTATGQVTASTTAGTLLAARASRRRATFINTDAAITVYIGPATVTAANGIPLVARAGITIATVDALQVIAASGTPVVGYVEEYD